MIIFDCVSHRIDSAAGSKQLLSSVHGMMPPNRRIALLGMPPEEKNILFDLLSGIILPSKGRIVRRCSVSFPVGYLGGFAAELTVRQNVEHVARLYETDLPETVAFVERLADLGPAFDEPFRELPRPLRKHLGPIVAFSLPFDVYLLTAGRKMLKDPTLQIFYRAFQERALSSGMLVATDPHFARLHCDMGLVLRSGQLQLFEDLEDAIAASDAANAEPVDDAFEPEQQTARPIEYENWS